MENPATAAATAASNAGESSLGSATDPLWTAIPMTILYAVLLITGVIGNVLTCVVIVRNRYMHTATNYYLFSLAISDLLLLVLGLPQEIYQIWHAQYVFGEAVCILRGFSSEASTNASILTITAFTVERYVAICHPLKAHTMSTLSRAIKLIVIIWVLGFLCAAPIAYQFGIVYQNLPGEMPGLIQSAACNIKRLIPYLEEHIFALQSLIMFVLPVTWISILYTLIGIKLRQSSRQTTTNNSVLSSSNRTQPDATTTTSSKRRRRPIKLRSVSVKNQSTSSSSSMFTGVDPPIDLHRSTGRSAKPQGLVNVELNESTRATNTTLVQDTTMPANNNNHSHHHSHKNGNNNNNNNNNNSNNNGTSKNRKKPSNKLRTTSSTISNTSSASGNSLAQRRAVIKMLTAVVVAFFVCFAPFHAQRLMAIYVKNPSQYETFAFTVLTYISGVTYYLSATINPILYSIMSVRFRQAFHDTFVRTFCASISEQINHHRSRRFTTSHTASKNSQHHPHPHPHHHHHSAYYTTFNHNHNSLEQGKNKSNNNNNNNTATATSVTVVGTTIVGIKKLTNNINNNDNNNCSNKDNVHDVDEHGGSNNNNNNSTELDPNRIEGDGGRTSKPEL